MKKDSTMIVALLDKSGSMKLVQDDTIGGFNTFIDEQKKVPGEATLTLVQFNDVISTTYIDVPLAHVAPLTKDTYQPSGWTSLNDALAQTIIEVGNKLAAKKEEDRPGKISVLIMTDGAENTSKEFGGSKGFSKVREMVGHQKDKYSWDFTFIGANMDAFAAASGYGIGARNSINYSATPMGSYNAFKSASRGMAAQRIQVAQGLTPDAFFTNESNSKSISGDSLDVSDILETVAKYQKTTTSSVKTEITKTLPTDKVTS